MVLLIALLTLEIVLNVYRIITKSKQVYITLGLRLFTLLVLIILFTSNLFTWGFRYYAIVFVLAFCALFSVGKILIKHTTEYNPNVYKEVLKTIGMVVLIFLVLTPLLIFPEYQMIPTTGNYEVGTNVEFLTDTNRFESYYDGDGVNRNLTIQFWYPVSENETFPLIVFSHGSFGTRTSNETLYRELASHGYVVCSIDHTFHSFYTVTDDGTLILMNMDYFGEVQRENARVNKEESLKLYQKWMDIRTGDINFVIDTIKNHQDDFAEGLIDTTKIGVMGHSLGGSAALGIGRLRDDIGAVVALESPFMCDILDVDNGEFVFETEEYPSAILNIYSDSSWLHLGEWPQYGKNYELLSSMQEDVFNVHIEGAYHLSLTDLSLVSPFLTFVLNGQASKLGTVDCLIRINEECLSFFDCYLKGKATYST